VGVRQRGVYCVSENGRLSSGCAQKTKPFTNEACNKRPCATWLTGDWGKVRGCLDCFKFFCLSFFVFVVFAVVVVIVYVYKKAEKALGLPP